MCTLIIGRHVLGRGSVIVAGNRDENPSRPSDPPGVLRTAPRVVGGRDAVAGGTWFAFRERRAAVAMLNRRDSPPPAGATVRSRGLLAIDLATVAEDYVPTTPLRSMVNPGDPLARAALHVARDALDASRFAPFSAVFISSGSCWVFAHRGGTHPPHIRSLRRGWHVITHADPDDPMEPRTAALLGRLSGWKPADFEEACMGLHERLSWHGTGADDAVCIHEGRMVTVSSFVAWLAPGEAGFKHLDGRPCEGTYDDYSNVLEGKGIPTKV